MLLYVLYVFYVYILYVFYVYILERDPHLRCNLLLVICKILHCKFVFKGNEDKAIEGQIAYHFF